MCLATLEQLETHLLPTVVDSLPPRTETMIYGEVTVLLSTVVLGGIGSALTQTSMVSIQMLTVEAWYGEHGYNVPPSSLQK